MSLAEQQWRRVSMHHMVLAWLRAERNSPNAKKAWSSTDAQLLANLLDKHDLKDAKQNRNRLRLIYSIRNLFMLEIPPDTQWHKVWWLTDADLNVLHVVNHHSWVDPADGNELLRVTKRKVVASLAEDPSKWNTPILWGHDKAGPFTIIEGNNRLTAYAASGRHDLRIPVIVGLSSLACHWHLPDHAGELIYDMLQQPQT